MQDVKFYREASYCSDRNLLKAIRIHKSKPNNVDLKEQKQQQKHP